MTRKTMLTMTGALLASSLLVACSGETATESSTPEAGDGGGEASNFYEDNDILIQVGFPPGGVYGLVAEIVAEHLPKHIPGEPDVLVDYRPGAVSLTNANAVYSTDPQDGTVLGSIHEALVTQEALGLDQVRFEAAEFQWLGSLMGSFIACAVDSDIDVHSLEDVIGSSEPLVLAAGAPGGANHDGALLLKELAGANLEIVPGYEGAAPIGLAIERGEADGTCAGYATFEGAAYSRMIEDGELRFFAAFGEVPEGLEAMEGVSRGEDFVDETGLQAMNLLAKPFVMSRPYVVGPEVPADRVEVLRQGFEAMFEDPDFLAAGESIDVTWETRNGEEVEALVAELLATPQDVADALADILASAQE